MDKMNLPRRKKKGGNHGWVSKACKKADGSYDLSNVPKEQRAIIEALWKQAERSEMLAKELREEKQRRIKKEFEERAREFENLPISAEELGQILQVFHAKAKDEFEKIEGLLRAVNEALGQSELFKEMGSSFNGPAGGAWSKVEKMAESLIQKDVSLTKEKAVALVLERNPDLYKQYLAEQQNKSVKERQGERNGMGSASIRC